MKKVVITILIVLGWTAFAIGITWWLWFWIGLLIENW